MKSKHDEKVFRIKLQFTIIGALAFTICLLSKNKQTKTKKTITLPLSPQITVTIIYHVHPKPAMLGMIKNITVAVGEQVKWVMPQCLKK